MARPFLSEDARRLIEEHRKIAERLSNALDAVDRYQSEISDSADKMAGQAVFNILKDIPVEELNREKRGFRTKALREAGFTSIADLAAATPYNIASVHGISEDSAYAIKNVVNSMSANAAKGIKIRLSLDDKTPSSTALVNSIYKYRKSRSLRKSLDSLIEFSKSSKLNYALEDLSIGTNGLRWMFSSKLRKQKAVDAYDFLNSLTNGEYGSRSDESLNEFRLIDNSDYNDSWNDFSSNSIDFFNILENVAPGLLGTENSAYGLPEELAAEIQDECFFPEGLLCTLRKYQEWGVKYTLHQRRVLLGDEMGLGKTVQAIATMVSLKNTGATHFVVVCPASVLTNWCREIMKHSLLRVTKAHGYDRTMALESWIKTGGVAVTTYETTAYFNLPEDFRFSLAVVDEAHYIKNPEAKRTGYVKELCSHTDRLMFMTGTALENKVDEMISLIGILQPEVAFSVRGMESLASAPLFREKVAPVYFRRRRADVLTELPELIESREWCTLLPEENAVYEQAVLGRHFAEARRVSWSVDDLRNSSKARRMLEIIQDAEADGRKVIVFSFFLDTIRKISLMLGDRCVQPINGSVNPQRRQEIIDEFDKAPAGTVLAAQIQSGGTGLNIQSASIVIICEPQFKPSIENQAISRAYRMGQTRNVLVYRLLCENTVDERISQLLDEKQKIFDEFADESVAASESIELDKTSFGNIIEEEIERINAAHAGTPVT